jgi:NAD(P)H-dependent FMN reductase
MIPKPQGLVLVIMGSVRASRRCPEIARWILELGAAAGLPAIELVDLRDWPLPADDEPGIPARGVYAQSHTRAWSEKINSAAGIIIVSPQYNWGYPAPLKNALDHLYHEWKSKPVMIVSYGGHGGGKCAAQLKQVFAGLKANPVSIMPMLTLTHAIIDGAPIVPEVDFATELDTVKQAISELKAGICAS